ncbi:hypothetical protein Gotur_034644, partial [Gossypium turneri]
MLPINYESWHKMPESNKNQALDNIKARFALEVSDAYVKKALGKRWRDHKSTLKKNYFMKKTTLNEKLQNVPPGMLRYQWEEVVRFWTSKKREDRARVGKSSRQKQKFTHTAGSKSFACVAQAEELLSGQKVRHLQLFDITHRKKDGNPMTPEAAEVMEKLKEKKAEYEAMPSSDSFVHIDDIDNRIITEVLGPERDQIAQMQATTVEQITQLKAEVASREAEVQQKYEELQLQLKAEATAREAEQCRKYDELQQQLQNMMKMFQQL